MPRPALPLENEAVNTSQTPRPKKNLKKDMDQVIDDIDHLFTMDSDSMFNDDDLFCCEEDEGADCKKDLVDLQMATADTRD